MRTTPAPPIVLLNAHEILVKKKLTKKKNWVTIKQRYKENMNLDF